MDAFGGNDTIYGGPDGDASLEGAEDNDKVYGGGGNDTIDAAVNDTDGSVDRSSGGKGNDQIFAVDLDKDIINCGKGKADEVRFDEGIDTIQNCEQKTAVVP